MTRLEMSSLGLWGLVPLRHDIAPSRVGLPHPSNRDKPLGVRLTIEVGALELADLCANHFLHLTPSHKHGSHLHPQLLRNLSARAAFDAMLDSPTGVAVLTTGSFDRMGIAVVDGPTGRLVIIDFGG